MAKLLRVPKGPLLTLSEDEVNKLGLHEKREYDFLKNPSGEWVLTEKPNPIDERILNILAQKELKDRVEGVFETFLNREEFERFKELINQKKIVPFKASEQYTKSVYKLPEELDEVPEKKAEAKRLEKTVLKSEEKKNAKKNTNTMALEASEDPFLNFEKKGFAVIIGEEIAKQFSEFYREAIQAREILGLKDFDGNYVVVAEELYETTAPKVLELLAKTNQATLQELEEYCKKDKTLVKGVCALLRESGQLIEKRNELYQLVK